MSYAVVAHTSTGGGGSQTTSGINTTGASLLVVAVGWLTPVGAAPALTDNKSNTWTPLTPQSVGGGPGGDNCQFYYVENPTVGSGHSFTIDQTGDIAVIALSGAKTSGAFDVENGSATQTTGSITPSQDNEVVATCYSGWVGGAGTTQTVDSGFTKIESSGLGSGGIVLAYLIQTTATAENVTWSDDGDPTSNYATAVASFKVAAAAPSNTGNFFQFF